MKRGLVCPVLVAAFACNLSTRAAPAKPPISRIEIIGGQAIVELVKGVSARSIVGLETFGDFMPGWTPADAETRFGKPKEVSESDYLTLFIYERGGKRVAIGRQKVIQSGGGPPGTSFDLRAFPSEDFLESLPDSLRDLIRSESTLREVHLSSDVAGDWSIHLHVRDGRVSYVSAVQGPPPQEQRRRSTTG